MQELEFLIKLGLTHGEGKVYLALLELKNATTGGIIKRASVSRSKVYEMLDKLTQKGLVSFVVKNKAKYYTASPPEEIRELITFKKKELDEQETVFEKIVPDLIKLFKNDKEQQTSTVYEGVIGIKKVYNLILSEMKEGEEYYAIAIEPESFSEDFSTFIQNYHQKRAKKKIKVSLLANKKLRNMIHTHLGKKGLIKIRYTQAAIPTSLLIFKNKVAHFVWGKDSFAVLISSQIISSRYKSFFQSMWKIAKK